MFNQTGFEQPFKKREQILDRSADSVADVGIKPSFPKLRFTKALIQVNLIVFQSSQELLVYIESALQSITSPQNIIFFKEEISDFPNTLKFATIISAREPEKVHLLYGAGNLFLRLVCYMKSTADFF